MERIAILDHDEHKLYVEDIDEDVLNNQYWGEEERYIREIWLKLIPRYMRYVSK